MKKTILYTGGFKLPDGNAAAQRVLSNAKVLDKLSYNVVFLGTSDQQLSKKVIDTHEIISGFSSYKETYPSNLMQWLSYLTSLKKIRKIINEIGVGNLEAIIAYNYPAIALYCLNIFCSKNNIKLFSDCTEWAVEPLNNSIRAILKNFDTYVRMELVNPRLDGLIAISNYLFEFYSKKMKNVVYIPPLVDITDNKWQLDYQEDKINLNLVYAGSPGNGAKDRIDMVINALSKIKLVIKRDFKLTIVGLTKEKYFLSFKTSNLPDNIENDVIFKGRLTHINSIKEVQKADFSIFFRDNNLVTNAGFPTKFVESITCGTPVLTNKSSNVQDYLKDGKLGIIINIESEQKLMESLIKVFSLPNVQINEMKQFCLNSKVFDYLNYIEDFEILLSKINFNEKNLN